MHHRPSSFSRALLLLLAASAGGAAALAVLEQLLGKSAAGIAPDPSGPRLEALCAGCKVAADAHGFTFVPFRGAEAARS